MQQICFLRSSVVTLLLINDLVTLKGKLASCLTTNPQWISISLVCLHWPFHFLPFITWMVYSGFPKALDRATKQHCITQLKYHLNLWKVKKCHFILDTQSFSQSDLNIQCVCVNVAAFVPLPGNRLISSAGGTASPPCLLSESTQSNRETGCYGNSHLKTTRIRPAMRVSLNFAVSTTNRTVCASACGY